MRELELWEEYKVNRSGNRAFASFAAFATFALLTFALRLSSAAWRLSRYSPDVPQTPDDVALRSSSASTPSVGSGSCRSTRLALPSVVHSTFHVKPL